MVSSSIVSRWSKCLRSPSPSLFLVSWPRNMSEQGLHCLNCGAQCEEAPEKIKRQKYYKVGNSVAFDMFIALLYWLYPWSFPSGIDKVDFFLRWGSGTLPRLPKDRAWSSAVTHFGTVIATIFCSKDIVCPKSIIRYILWPSL